MAYTNRATLYQNKHSRLERAFETKDKRSVVLKFAPLDALRREELAFQAASKKALPGLVRCYGFDHEESALVLEWLPGPSLAQLRLEGRFVGKEKELLSLALKLCKTLQLLHARGVIHRDISPNNVVLSDGEPRLIDLGLALVESPLGVFEPFAAGRIGTSSFTAPEISDSYPGDARADLFSLGVLLLTLARDPRDPPTARPRLSPRLRSIFEKASARVPKDRFNSATDLQNALRNYKHAQTAKRAATSKPLWLLAAASFGFFEFWQPELEPVPASAPAPTTQALFPLPASLPASLPVSSATQPVLSPLSKKPKKFVPSPESPSQRLNLEQDAKELLSEPWPKPKPLVIKIVNNSR